MKYLFTDCQLLREGNINHDLQEITFEIKQRKSMRKEVPDIQKYDLHAML